MNRIWNRKLIASSPNTITRRGYNTIIHLSTVFNNHHNHNNNDRHQWTTKYNHPFTSTSSSSSLQAQFNDNNNNNNKEYGGDLLVSFEDQLKDIETQFQRLNDGRSVNLNSPKQVANALFQNSPFHSSSSSSPSTSKHVLETIAQTGIYPQSNITMSQQERQMAHLVLKFRHVKSQQRNNHPTTTTTTTQRSHFSTTTTTVTSNHHPTNNSSNSPNKNVTSPSPSLKKPQTDSTFQQPRNDPSSLIHPFWDDVISHVSKPAAKSMIQQLNPMICPMGYDPLATPLDSIPNTKNNPNNIATSQTTTTTTTTATTTAGKKGSLLSYVRDQKQKYPDSIILTRVGEFYEAFGLDAALLVEFCGLNPMAGKARAGCPIKNIQQTLDCLTNKGFRVAVYEEASDTDSSTGTGATGGAKSRLKTRMLAQIVSPASPTYMYDLLLEPFSSSSSTIARPYVGIISASAGYTIVEVASEERTVRISERVTAEAVACRLAAYPPADPLFYVPSPGEQQSSDYSTTTTALPFLPSRSDANNNGPGSRAKLKILPPQSFMQGHSPGVSDLDRAKKCIVSALLDMSQINEFINASSSSSSTNDPSNTHQLTHDDFLVVSSTDMNASLLSSVSSEDNYKCEAKPLHMETATQLGLMTDPTIPSLVKYLLPESAPASTRRFLRRWLLTPPPPNVADSMAALVLSLKNDGESLPPLTVPPIGKVLSLIRAGQTSANVFRELLACLDSTISVIDGQLMQNGITETKPNILIPLMVLLSHESGMAAEPLSLKERCLDTMKIIEEVINAYHHTRHDDGSCKIDSVCEFEDIIPVAFFERNEALWRGRIKPNAAREAYDIVHKSAKELAMVVARDFWGSETKFDAWDVNDLNSKESKSPIVQDIFNNQFAIKEIPSWAKENKNNYFHPRDRNGKLLRNRYTTTDVESALSNYLDACESASNKVKQVLVELSERLCDTGHLPALVQAAHTNLILSTAAQHAASSNALGWNMASLRDADELGISSNGNDDVAGHFHELWPYWMDRSQAVVNSFSLDGLFLLTAPNMSGKSTLMRSTSAAALLTNCGLCAPLGPESYIRRFDSIFVRGASSDVPTENKSAFGAEMTDVAALIRTCGSKSLVFVDELGRGTSPSDGTSLAAAVLESMAESKMSGIFATHLHGMIDLPFSHSAASRIKKKRMAIHDDSAHSAIEWTYKLEDGICTDSLALVTAARFGVPDQIIARATDFSSYLESPLIKKESSKYSPEIFESVKNGKPINSLTGKFDQNTGLNFASNIVEEITGEKIKFIPARWTTPSSLEGFSCVYVLQLKSDGKVSRSNSRYYVGETDKLSQRLRQHRSKGTDWAMLDAIAIKIVGGKSDARNIESILIRKMVDAGYNLMSITDGRQIRSLGSMSSLEKR